jgi:hypothetical protein
MLPVKVAAALIAAAVSGRLANWESFASSMVPRVAHSVSAYQPRKTTPASLKGNVGDCRLRAFRQVVASLLMSQGFHRVHAGCLQNYLDPPLD